MPIINYTGSSAAAVFAAGVINASHDIAQTKMAQVDTYATQAINAASADAPTLNGIAIPSVSATINTGDVLARRSTLLAEMGTGATELISQLANMFAGFLSTNFPWDAEYTAAQAWVNKALTTGGTGLSPFVEDQIWQRERDRLQDEAQQGEEEITAAWAARRYPLPPGAAAHQLLMVRQNLRDNLAKSSREVAIKQAEIELENTRFALTTALDVRKASVQAGLDYLARMTFGYTFPAEKVVQSAQASAQLEQALTAYYQAQVGLKELLLKNSMGVYEIQTQFVKDKAQIELGYLKEKVGAITNAMQAISVQAAATLNALHASTGYTGTDV